MFSDEQMMTLNEFLGDSMKRLYFIIIILLASLASLTSGQDKDNPKFDVELELGPVWQTVNDVQIPNNKNWSRFSLVDLVGKGPYPAGRLYFTWNINEKHGLRLLLAPLIYTQQGKSSDTIYYKDTSFAPATPTDATYKFNSWRLTYRYLFLKNSHWHGWVGFTAKIRDAKIELAQGSKSSNKPDLGFVPLLHLNFGYRFSDHWRAEFDLDALAGGPGRAEDGSLKLYYQLNDKLSASIGYRTVEGGADVDEVYTFAWFHFATASIRYNF